MVKKAKVILPRKMSALITVALKDLKKVEKADGYTVDMGDWHHPDTLTCRNGSGDTISEEDTCSVCFAGSVMAFTLKVASTKEAEPHSFPGNEDQLQALDSLRAGNVSDAARTLNLPGDSDGYYAKYAKYDTCIPYYEYMKPKPFHTAMEKLAARLKKAGL